MCKTNDKIMRLLLYECKIVEQYSLLKIHTQKKFFVEIHNATVPPEIGYTS